MYYRSLYSHKATGWTGRVSNTGGGNRLFLKSSGLALGLTKYFIELTRCPFPGGVKQSGREVNHAPPSIADVKNDWNYTFAILHALMEWIGKPLTFTFTTKFNIQKFCILPTQYVYVFFMVLRSNRDCFTQQY